MPTFNILLAHDVTFYGNVCAEGDTWEEAVASLTDLDWMDNCADQGDAWEERVVHVETDDGDIVAEDINYNTAMIHYVPVVHRLTHILDTCAVPDDAAAALVAFIGELQAMRRDPVFKRDA